MSRAVKIVALPIKSWQSTQVKGLFKVVHVDYDAAGKKVQLHCLLLHMITHLSEVKLWLIKPGEDLPEDLSFVNFHSVIGTGASTRYVFLTDR